MAVRGQCHSSSFSISAGSVANYVFKSSRQKWVGRYLIPAHLMWSSFILITCEPVCVEMVELWCVASTVSGLFRISPLLAHFRDLWAWAQGSAEMHQLSQLWFGSATQSPWSFLVFANLNILINVNVFSHPNLAEFDAFFLDNFDNMRLLPLPATLKSNLLLDMPYSHTHMHTYTCIHTFAHTLNGH